VVRNEADGGYQRQPQRDSPVHPGAARAAQSPVPSAG